MLCDQSHDHHHTIPHHNNTTPHSERSERSEQAITSSLLQQLACSHRRQQRTLPRHQGRKEANRLAERRVQRDTVVEYLVCIYSYLPTDRMAFYPIAVMGELPTNHPVVLTCRKCWICGTFVGCQHCCHHYNRLLSDLDGKLLREVPRPASHTLNMCPSIQR